MRDEKHRAAPAALAILVMAAACAVAAEPPEAPPEDDLATAHADRFAAMVASDPDALAPMLADELTYAHSDGRVESKEQLLASLAAGGLAYLAIASDGESVIRRYGDGEVGVITGAARFLLGLGERKVERTLRYTSVYVLRDGRWRLAAWHSSPIRP